MSLSWKDAAVQHEYMFQVLEPSAPGPTGRCWTDERYLTGRYPTTFHLLIAFDWNNPRWRNYATGKGFCYKKRPLSTAKRTKTNEKTKIINTSRDGRGSLLGNPSVRQLPDNFFLAPWRKKGTTLVLASDRSPPIRRPFFFSRMQVIFAPLKFRFINKRREL